MWDFLLEIVVDLTVAWCSWCLWICILLAVGIMIGAYYKFPDHDGLWPLTAVAGVMIITFGIWWQWRADRS